MEPLLAIFRAIGDPSRLRILLLVKGMELAVGEIAQVLQQSQPGQPVVLEPGNHDMPYYNPWERFTDPFRRYNRLRQAVPGGFVSEDVVLVPLLLSKQSSRLCWLKLAQTK